MKNEIHTRIGSGTPWESEVGYSRVVRVGPLIEIAGTTATRDGKVLFPGDAYAQARVIFGKIRHFLQEVDADWEDVVRTRMYVTDIRHWQGVGKAHGEVFADLRPVTTLVEVSALIDPDMMVEIEVSAWKQPPNQD